MNNECIFCKIAAGEMPSTKVYEDNNVIAIMDIGPVAKGHTLVIPREHYDPITDTPDDVLCNIISVARKIAQAQMKGLQADGINISQANGKCAGQIIPHIHFHLIPRFNDDPNTRNWTPGAYDSQDEMLAYAKKIKEALVQQEQ